MPIRFSCPECQAPVTVNEALAGLHTRCPACGANVGVPDTAYGGPGPAPARYDAPTPARYDEEPRRYDQPAGWDDPGPYRRPAAAGNWTATRQGLTVEFVAAILGLVVFLGYIGVGCGSLFIFRHRFDRSMETLLSVVAILLLVAGVCSIVLMLVGRCMACTAPSEGGLRGLAISAASCFGAALLMVGLFFLVAFATGFRRDSEVLGVVLVIFGGLVLLAGHILWCIFLRGVAAAFGDNSLGVQVIVFLIVSIVLPIVVVLVLFLLALSMAFGRGGGTFVMDVIAFVMSAVVGLVIQGWYTALVSRVRGVIARGARGGSGSGYWES